MAILQKGIAPEKKTQITKQSMFTYIKTYGTDEDKAWFKETCLKYKVQKMNNLTRELCDALDIKEVRKAFIERFYPEAFKKPKKPKKKIPTFFEELDKL